MLMKINHSKTEPTEKKTWTQVNDRVSIANISVTHTMMLVFMLVPMPKISTPYPFGEVWVPLKYDAMVM
jgi:hypothetical protein